MSISEVGITGGIGSGKSTVARIFESFGYEVYYADDRAKALYTKDEEVRSAVIALFGADIYTDSGQLDRKKLAGIVFEDKSLLEKLNGIVHPATGRDFERWISALEGRYDKPFILKEAAILFEAGTWTKLDAVVAVYAPKWERISRVCKRDEVAPEQVRDRMDHQWPESEKHRRSDFIIYNDFEHMLIPQVRAAIEFLGRL